MASSISPTSSTAAAEVADHYDTIHHEVVIHHMLDRYPHILAYFPRPRFNLWIHWLAEAAHQDGCETCYIGEGADEHFGGYWYKPRMSYVQQWSGFFTYVYSTYQTIYNHFGLRLEAPLHPDNLSWQRTLPFYDVAQEKRQLRKAYKHILPKFVLNRKKQNGRFSYWVIWEDEMKARMSGYNPKTEEDIRNLLNQWVIEQWLLVHKQPVFALASPV